MDNKCDRFKITTNKTFPHAKKLSWLYTRHAEVNNLTIQTWIQPL